LCDSRLCPRGSGLGFGGAHQSHLLLAQEFRRHVPMRCARVGWVYVPAQVLGRRL
jgi:hypothetical protein